VGIGAIALVPAPPALASSAIALPQAQPSSLLAQGRFRWPWEKRQTTEASQTSPSSTRTSQLKWPTSLGTPKSSAGTGSRGNCSLPTDALPLTRIGGSKPMHKTVSDRPEIWFYSPYRREDVAIANFSLHFADQQGDDEVYRQTVAMPIQASLVNVTLPATAPALIPDLTYRWYLEIPCSQGGGDIG
jgi:hypothetical protein